MKTYFSEKTGNDVIIKVEGRIDTLNAAQFGAEVDRIHALYPDCMLHLDFLGTEYMTSCGLREIMRFIKSGYRFELFNVNQDVYIVLSTTGMTEFVTARRRINKVDVTGCTVIGRGANGIVYKISDDTIVKVFFRANADIDKILNERLLAKKALVAGVPTAISFGLTEADGKPALIFELIDAKSLSKLFGEDRGNIDKYVADYVALVKKIHSIDPERLDYPVISQSEELLKKLETIRSLIGEEAAETLKEIITSVSQEETLLHGDIQPNNVMATGGELLIIDLDTMTKGVPLFDLAFLYRTLCIFRLFSSEEEEKAFLMFGSDTADALWSRFIRLYYEGESEEFIAETEKKCRAVGLLAILSREVSRHGHTEMADRMTELLKEACADIGKLAG